MTEAQTKAMIDRLNKWKIQVDRFGVFDLAEMYECCDADDLYAYLIRQAYLSSIGE